MSEHSLMKLLSLNRDADKKNKEDESDTPKSEGSGTGSENMTADSNLPSPTFEDEYFRPCQHALASLNKMEMYFSRQKLTDVVLIAGNKRISAHRLVLSASSDYFAAMFTNDLCEATQNEIKLQNVDGEALLTLVHYCYSGTINLLEDTVGTLLETACLMQFHEIVSACCNFLQKHLHPSNCIGIQLYADSLGCTDLLEVSHNYIVENFLEVVKNQEFLILSSDEFAKLLASDDLNVSSEEDTFYALMAWLEHDLPKRTAEISKLLGFIKLPLLSPSFIVDHMESAPLFRDNLKCRELIMEAFKYHLLPERRTSLHLRRILPRKSTLGDLYAVGGNNNKSGVISIENYNVRADKWILTTHTNIRRLQFGVAVVDEKIYIIGGRDGLKTLNTVECYDVKKKTWSSLPKMLTYRHGLGVGVLEGPLYAVGGHDGWSFLNTVERWDPQARTWSNVAPMLYQRSTLGVAALNGRLYAVGGRDGSCCLKTVECYNPHTNKWMPCASMIKRRGCVGVGILNGYLYAVGGSDAPSLIPFGKRLESVERYDPKSDIWSMVASISTSRDAIGVCLLGKKLFAVGGHDGKSYLKLVEAYDPEENQWEEVTPLRKKRAGACVVAIKLDSNGST